MKRKIKYFYIFCSKGGATIPVEEEKERFLSSPSSIVIQRQQIPTDSVIGGRRAFLNALLKPKSPHVVKEKSSVKRRNPKKSKFDMLLTTVQPLLEVIY